MNKSSKFNNVLDECLERLLARGETIEQVLQRYPQHADELKPLLETALVTRQVTAIQPRPEFREGARHRFNLALQTAGQVTRQRGFTFGWHPRWATVVAAVLAVLLAGGGTAAAASGSMPDSPLYRVKLAAEQVQMALTFSELGKAELHTRLADKRVTEIAYLTERDEPETMALTIGRLDSHLTSIAILVSGGDVVSMLATAPAAEVKKVPPPEREAVMAVERAVKEGTGTEEKKKGAEAPAPAPSPLAAEPGKSEKKPEGKGGRRAKVKENVVRRADSNLARLRALLKTAKAQEREELERAIARYEEVLKSLKD